MAEAVVSRGLAPVDEGAPRRARAGRGGGQPRGRPAGDGRQAGGRLLHQRSRPRPASRASSRTRSSSRASRSRTSSRARRTRRCSAAPISTPDLDLYDPSVHDVDAARALAHAKAAEAAARALDARITNSEGATFTRASGAKALVTSGGFRGATQRHLRVALGAPGGRRRGRQEAQRLLLDRAAAPREPPARRGGRRGGCAAHAGASSARARSRRRRCPVVFDPDVGALHPRAARGLHQRRRDLAPLELPGRPRGRPRGQRAGDRRRRPAASRARRARAPSTARACSRGATSSSRSGVLKTYLLDSYSARKLGKESTASASRGGERRRQRVDHELRAAAGRRWTPRKLVALDASAASTSPR